MAARVPNEKIRKTDGSGELAGSRPGVPDMTKAAGRAAGLDDDGASLGLMDPAVFEAVSARYAMSDYFALRLAGVDLEMVSRLPEATFFDAKDLIDAHNEGADLAKMVEACEMADANGVYLDGGMLLDAHRNGVLAEYAAVASRRTRWLPERDELMGMLKAGVNGGNLAEVLDHGDVGPEQLSELVALDRATPPKLELAGYLAFREDSMCSHSEAVDYFTDDVFAEADWNDYAFARKAMQADHATIKSWAAAGLVTAMTEVYTPTTGRPEADVRRTFQEIGQAKDAGWDPDEYASGRLRGKATHAELMVVALGGADRDRYVTARIDGKSHAEAVAHLAS